jgi:hypothetical protein
VPASPFGQQDLTATSAALLESVRKAMDDCFLLKFISPRSCGRLRPAWMEDSPCQIQPGGCEVSPGSLDREQLHLEDERRVRPDLAARSPLPVRELRGDEELPLGAYGHDF